MKNSSLHFRILKIIIMINMSHIAGSICIYQCFLPVKILSIMVKTTYIFVHDLQETDGEWMVNIHCDNVD